MRPKAVFFDCDGVLVDSEPISERIIGQRLRDFGFQIAEDELSGLFLGGTISGLAETARAKGATLPDDWVDGTYAAIYAALEKGTPLIDGVVDALDRLDTAGIPYGVGSNGSREKMQITLGQNCIWDRFENAMASAHDGLPAKPAPDIYLELAKQLGVAPRTALVIDDSPNGIGGALAAGIPAIGFAERTDPESLSALGIPVARSMSQIMEMIGV